MRGWACLGAALAPLLLADVAQAEPVFTGRVSLTGLYYGESESAASAPGLASPASLGYADLRGVLEGKRLWKDKLDVRLDLRLRLTGSFDYDAKFMGAPMDSTLGTSARGYVGGREYDLREVYGRLRLSDLYTLQVGRMFVNEADILKIDGARMLRKFGGHWEGSIFLGGYPNPYSRSLLSDYTPPCGAGVAAAQTAFTPAPDSKERLLGAACDTGPKLGLAAGITARYEYSTLWGALAFVGSVFGAAGDGGPVQVETDPAQLVGRADPLAALKLAAATLDAPRVYVSWINSFRPIERLDLFADLVVDLYGSGGPQITRLVTLGTLRLLKDDRLTLRLGYTRMSSLAINMYLSRMVYNRVLGSTLLESGAGLVQSNLTVLRTARDEVRATADVKIVKRLGAYLDGRFRHRSLSGGDGDPAVWGSPVYTQNTANYGLELAAGLRDSGTVYGIRAALSYIALFNFRGSSDVLSLDLGRDFYNERLTIDFQYVLGLTRDNGVSQAGTSCSALAPFGQGCFGQRSGMTHEIGLTVTAHPWSKLFLLLDYRFTGMLTSPIGPDPATAVQVPTVYGNSILLRGEYRW